MPGSGAGSGKLVFERVDHHGGTLPAQPVDAQPVGDVVRPGRDAAIRLPVGGLPPEADEHLLHDLLGLRGARGKRGTGKAQQCRGEAAHQLSESGVVALGDGGHDRLVGVNACPIQRIARLIQAALPSRETAPPPTIADDRGPAHGVHGQAQPALRGARPLGEAMDNETAGTLPSSYSAAAE